LNSRERKLRGRLVELERKKGLNIFNGDINMGEVSVNDADVKIVYKLKRKTSQWIYSKQFL
jgi:hypothetical protein